MRTTIAVSLSFVFAALPVSALGAQGSPVPRAQPSASPSLGSAAAPATSSTAVTFVRPRWRRIDVGQGPTPREDHTWTVDAAGRHAYLFGGRDGASDFGELWRYDLDRDSWEWLEPRGGRPAARFGHSAVWIEGTGLVIFAGQRGSDFFGDLWVFDPETGAWRELPAHGGAPKARYGSCMVVGRDGRLWISHGFTFAGRFDDTRAYNLRTERWASVAPDGRRPGERCLHDCWTSATGQLVLYGGQNDSTRALGDLWVMRPNGTWQKQPAPRLRARRLYAVTEAGPFAYVFGGADKADTPLDDLWRVDRSDLHARRVRVDGNGPSGRSAGTLITDAARGRLLLFGGKGDRAMGDLWELVDEGDPPQDAVVASESPGASASASPAAPAAASDVVPAGA